MLLVAGEAKVGTGSIAHPTESTVKRLKSNEGETEKKNIGCKCNRRGLAEYEVLKIKYFF